MKKWIGIIFGILLLSVNLSAEGKKTIQVRFTIAEKQYEKHFKLDKGLIENRCSSLMADFLDETFGFFNFTTEENEHVLHIDLIDKEQNLSAHSGLKEVGFKVFVKQKENLGIAQPVFWVLRSADQDDEMLPDDKDIFINEIIQSFKRGVSNNKEALVKNILSKVEVADDFYFIQEKKWFILPLGERDSNIADSSQFLIMTLVLDDLIGLKVSDKVTTVVLGPIKYWEVAKQKYNLPDSYPEGSLALERLPDGTIELPADFSQVGTKIKKIFILKHLPVDKTENEIISPGTFLSTQNPE
ncbi:MAG TPA: hypothetical protein DCR40_05410 [Prolixibacteraceae bacterium]|nr:hypothetical protein [Prolixibacteraceae bacterium]